MEYGLKITTNNEIMKIDDEDYKRFLENTTEYNKYERGFNGVEWDIYEMNEDLFDRTKDLYIRGKSWPLNIMGSVINGGEGRVFGDVFIFFNNIEDLNKKYRFWKEYIKTL